MNLFDKTTKSKKSAGKVELTTITRTETIEGFSIPGIIQNNQYYFTHLQVYSDGLIDCWGMVDISMFAQKLIDNWVVTSIPDGQVISISDIGWWVVKKGNWTYNKDTFYKHVYSLMEELKPTLENLHNYNGSNVKTIGKVNIAKHAMPNPKPFYYDKPDTIFPKKITGEKFSIFFRDDDEKTYLVELAIFQNGIIEITNLPQKKRFHMENLKSLIDEGQLATELKVGELVTILGLGSFTVTSGEGIDINSKYDEFVDKFYELNGLENAVAKCSRVFGEYMQNPTLKSLQQLTEAYELIPKHQRMYVGTMDTKDYEVRLAIYGDIVKKEWEDNYGFKYPYQDIPKPVDV